MKAIERIFQAFGEGRPALLVTGRSLYDFEVDSQGTLRPLLEVLRRTARERHGMLLVNYSLAGGLDWDQHRVDDERDRRTIENVLRAHGLTGIPQDQNVTVRVIRGVSSLSRTPTDGLKWADGRPMRFVFLFEFGEHLAPGSLTNGTQSDAQLVVIELAHLTAQSLTVRKSGNLVIFHGRHGLLDELVAEALHPVRLCQPDQQEKRQFFEAATSLYSKATFEPGLTPETMAHLTRNTPNRGAEALLRASSRTGRAITAAELVEQKNRDVEQMSEHTLTVLDTSRVAGVELRGVNVSAAQRILDFYAAALLKGDASMPANVLLVGPPGIGKTDLAILTARQAKAAAFQMHSPKSGLVGETERKARLQQTVLREWIPNIAFTDEITESMPLERSEFDGDSGASRAVQAALLTALSDETRRGRSLLIAATNCPWRAGAAMRSRFTVVPVLHPLEQDYAGIVEVTARRVDPSLKLDPASPALAEAAKIFSEKGANPRHIRQALSNVRLLKGSLDERAILFAAHDLCSATDQLSAVFADLWAVKCCSSLSYLPWAQNPQSYPFPAHLRDVVDPRTGMVNHQALDRKIEQLRPAANV